MPYVQPSPNRLVRGTITSGDKPAIVEALAAAGIDTGAIACTVTDSGNAFFVRDLPAGRPNAIADQDLIARMNAALDEAGWVLCEMGSKSPAEVLGRPVPRELWTIDQVAAFLGVQTGSARGQLSRWGLAAHDYQRSGSGRPQGRFDAELVRALAGARPGQGARTDRPTTLEHIHANFRHPGQQK